MHQWITDCGHTPHVIVDASVPGASLPRAYVRDDRIVLNIGHGATDRLELGGEWLDFAARFGGVVHHVRVPMGARSAGGMGTMMWHIFGAAPDKPILLLFHGGSGSWIHWIRNVLPLSQNFSVYAADLPGLGDSDPPDDVNDIWSVTHCVEAAMKELLSKKW